MKFDIDNIRKSMGRKKKTPKKTLEIGSPTGFQHLIHVGAESLRPSLSNESKLIDVPRPNSELKPGSVTLPRNFRQNSCTNALPSPLDFPIPNHDEQTAYDSTCLYNPGTGHKSRSRSRLPSEWGPLSTPSTPRPIHRTSQESFNQSLVMNQIYMHQTSSRGAVTPGSSNYGTMTDFMGTTRSNGSSHKIINSNYVDKRDIERYRDRSVEHRSFDEQPRKGILKNARSDSGLNLVEEEYLVPNEIVNRTYQQLPYKSPTPFDTNSSLGRRIRSSTNSEQKKNGMNPSPLARPSQLEIAGARNEGAISVVPTTPITPVLSTYFDQQTPLVLCEFTEPKTMSILVKDERPLSVRTIQEVPSSLGSDDSTEDIIIYHL